MRSPSIFALLIFVTLGFSWAQPLPVEARDTISRAVVKLEPYDVESGAYLDWSGSGTIVSPSGYILTNYHVVADEESGALYQDHAVSMTEGLQNTTQEPAFSYWARYVAGNPTIDVAILKIFQLADESPLEPGTVFPYIPVADSLQVLPLDEIIVVGYPGSASSLLTFTKGIVSGWSNDDFNGGGKSWLRTDAEIDAGNSGGAALNARGELIGIPTACFYTEDEEEVEKVCAARPTHLAFGLAAWNIPDLKRAGTFTETNPAPAEYPSGPTASGPYGKLELGASVTSVVAGSPEDGPIVYHSYTLRLPAGQTSVSVTVDGLGKDIDLALNPGKAIETLAEFSDAQIYDTSAATRHTHTLRNLKVRTVHIAVLNLLASSVAYELTAR